MLSPLHNDCLLYTSSLTVPFFEPHHHIFPVHSAVYDYDNTANRNKFLVFFLELRKRTGGYHLDKYYKCYLATIVSYLVIVIISARLSEHPQWLFAILVIAITGIVLIGTANHPNMHMTLDELTESKKAARIITLLEGCIILGCILLEADMVYISYMAIAVILCAALLCIAKIFKQEVKE